MIKKLRLGSFSPKIQDTLEEFGTVAEAWQITWLCLVGVFFFRTENPPFWGTYSVSESNLWFFIFWEPKVIVNL